MEAGWKTVIAGKGERLSLRDGCLLSEGNRENPVPLFQVRELIIEQPRGSITLALLSELSTRGIRVLLCDERGAPAGELCPVRPHSGAGEMIAQAQWKQADRDRVWKRVAEDKIRMQKTLLERIGKDVPPELEGCLESVLPGDSSNREGQAARLYFSALFGKGFHRHGADDVNCALNYGYAIVRSMVSRVIAAHGYHTALGLWHRSRSNPFNLSCDLMEPFRPVVDEMVFYRLDRTWDSGYRRDLIALPRHTVRFDGRVMELAAAAESYALDVLTAVGDKERRIGKVDFYG